MQNGHYIILVVAMATDSLGKCTPLEHVLIVAYTYFFSRNVDCTT